MKNIKRPKVKICCVMNIDEAEMAINAGAYALGLVSEMPSGPGVISEELIGQIAGFISKKVKTILLTSKQDADNIIKQHKKCKTSSIQLVDSIPANDLVKLRKSLDGIELIQVIHVTDLSSVDQAKMAEPLVDMILLDSGNPQQPVKQLGGTGRTHNWEISSKIVSQIEKPVFLAGGLRTENVRQAVKEVRPFGLDVCSGVRTNGKLDPVKLKNFFNEVNRIL